MKKPNIVYILADDMGYGDLSCMNPDSKVKTTNLDRLASGGMRFSDAHASSAVCTPSRYSILTGRYNWRSVLKHGVTFGYDKSIIEPGRMTVASFLKANGYHTACVGKWHLGWDWPVKPDSKDVDFTKPIKNGPTDFGFDCFFGISASLDMPPYVYIHNDMPTAVPDRIVPEEDGKRYWREGPIAPDFRHEEVLPKLTEKVIQQIDASAADPDPFYIYFPMPAPHTPILPLDEFKGKSGTNEYGDFCLQVDSVVGQVMEALDRNGIADNTIVVFTADNGCSPMADFEELGRSGHNPSYIFRGHKADIYEGGHRIPLVIRWPAVMKAGSVSEETICLTDFLATCADILECDLPDNAAEDSVSNLPIWHGDKLDAPLREATVHTSIDGSLSIRQGKWKLEMCAGSGGWSSPRPGPECEGLPKTQLYNLNADIGERKNLEAEYPDKAKELTDLLTEYVRNGRSTPGTPQENFGNNVWKQLWWLHD